MKAAIRRCVAALAIVASLPPAHGAEVFRCGEPTGTRIASNEDFKPGPDGYRGVKPVVLIEGDLMTVLWGDTKQFQGGKEKAWKAVVFHRDNETVSAIASDDSPHGMASILYTMDLKRRVLFMSHHKTFTQFNVSLASSFVAKCED